MELETTIIERSSGEGITVALPSADPLELSGIIYASPPLSAPRIVDGTPWKPLIKEILYESHPLDDMLCYIDVFKEAIDLLQDSEGSSNIPKEMLEVLTLLAKKIDNLKYEKMLEI